VYIGDKLWNDSFVVTMCSIGLIGRVVSLPVYTRPFKPIEHIVTTKLSFHNLSPVYKGPKEKHENVSLLSRARSVMGLSKIQVTNITASVSN
jgi:hypothetical protein